MRAALRSALAFLLLHVGCQGPGLPADVTACDDAACRQSVVVTAFQERGPDAAAEQIRKLPASDERIAVILYLFETDPERSTQLCNELPKGPTLARCQRATHRPHLWSPARVEVEATTARLAPGPPHSYLQPDPALRSVFSGGALSASRCEQSEDPRSCLTQDAVAHLHQGRPERAARACRAIDETRWRSECFFNIAEASLERSRTEGYVDASNLCLDAGDYAANCIAHLSLVLAAISPSSTLADPSFWGPVLQGALTIEAAWRDRDAAFGTLLVDRYWADVAAAAFAGTNVISGDLLDLLPAPAAPHIRAAAAHRLVNSQWEEGRTLDAWLVLLRDALASRGVAVELKVKAVRFLDVPDRWASDQPGDEQMPAIFYMGTSRRTWSAEADEELTLCLLEALGRREAPPTALLEAAAADPRKAVAWTARRLLNPEVNSPPEVPGPSGPSAVTPGR